MRRAILLLLAIAPTASEAFGHGFDLTAISTPGGLKLVGTNNGDPTSSDQLFAEYWTASAPDDYLSIHGAVIDTGGLPAGSNLSLRFLGPLWYSNGGTAINVPGTEAVEGTSFDDLDEIGSVILTGTSTAGATMAVTGVSDHSIGWSLTPFPAVAGSYGFGYQVIGTHGGGAFVASDPLVVVLSTPGFTGSVNGTVAQSRTEIYNAITASVPEPSTWLLAGLGLAAFLGVAIRRRRQAIFV